MNGLDFAIKRSKVKGQGHSESTQGQINYLGGIFKASLGMYGLVKLVIVTHYQVYVTLITVSRSWVQRSRSQTTFPINALVRRRHSDRQFAV